MGPPRARGAEQPGGDVLIVQGVEAMPLYAGQAVAAVTVIRPAAQVVAELGSGAARLLERVGVAA